MSRKQREIAAFFSVLIALSGIAVLLCKNAILRLTASELYPVCPFHELTGYLCPGCGNTRAVTALLNGAVLQSLGYNPTILILTVILAGFYIELVCRAFGRRVIVIPRSNVFLFATISLVIAYDAARNFFPWMTTCF